MSNVGFFGKIPSAGDFVSRNLSSGLCDSMDRLLQTALMAATSDSADRRQVMAHAPPVMLSIRPGTLSETGFTGLWFPSCDRVGRVFPLCVGMETGADVARLPLTWPSLHLTRGLCQVVATALQQSSGTDELLARLPSVQELTRMVITDVPFSDADEETVPAVSIDNSNFWLEGPETGMSISSRALCSRLPWASETIGVTVGPNGSPAVFFASTSMLTWAHFAALFDGRWDYWGWVRYGAGAELAEASLPWPGATHP